MYKSLTVLYFVMSSKERDFLSVPSEEYVVKHENGGFAVMERYEKSWFPFSRTHLEEARYRSKNLDLGQGMRVLGYLITMQPLLYDVCLSPFTAFYKLKDRISRK